MSWRSCCLLCVTQARSRSLWSCREQAPTKGPISEAALGVVLTLGDFQRMISHSCVTPLLVNHMPRFSTSSALKPEHTWPGSLLYGRVLDGEKRDIVESELCLVGGGGTLCYVLYHCSPFLGFTDTGVFTTHLVWHVKQCKYQLPISEMDGG